jgi:hypothetical protein
MTPVAAIMDEHVQPFSFPRPGKQVASPIIALARVAFFCVLIIRDSGSLSRSSRVRRSGVRRSGVRGIGVHGLAHRRALAVTLGVGTRRRWSVGTGCAGIDGFRPDVATCRIAVDRIGIPLRPVVLIPHCLPPAL